jgi:hypothetical protein
MSSDVSTFGRASTDRLARFGEELLAALVYPFRAIPRALLTVTLAILTFSVLILASQPFASYQMFIVNLFAYSDLATYVLVLKQTWLMNFHVTVLEYGWSAIVLSGVSAVLTGIALTNMIAQLRMLQVGGIANTGGVLPSVVAASCASCGPGLFALLGFTGAVTFIPFQGTVLRLAGIGLFLFFLGLSGDPRNCRIE